jgi:hypothetical protein
MNLHHDDTSKFTGALDLTGNLALCTGLYDEHFGTKW